VFSVQLKHTSLEFCTQQQKATRDHTLQIVRYQAPRRRQLLAISTLCLKKTTKLVTVKLEIKIRIDFDDI